MIRYAAGPVTPPFICADEAPARPAAHPRSPAPVVGGRHMNRVLVRPVPVRSAEEPGLATAVHDRSAVRCRRHRMYGRAGYSCASIGTARYPWRHERHRPRHHRHRASDQLAGCRRLTSPFPIGDRKRPGGSVAVLMTLPRCDDHAVPLSGASDAKESPLMKPSRSSTPSSSTSRSAGTAASPARRCCHLPRTRCCSPPPGCIRSPPFSRAAPPLGSRLVNVQRCLRTTDLEEVGDPPI